MNPSREQRRMQNVGMPECHLQSNYQSTEMPWRTVYQLASPFSLLLIWLWRRSTVLLLFWEMLSVGVHVRFTLERNSSWGTHAVRHIGDILALRDIKRNIWRCVRYRIEKFLFVLERAHEIWRFIGEEDSRLSFFYQSTIPRIWTQTEHEVRKYWGVD